MAENMVINFSLIYQVILFLIFALIVNYWIFRPTLRLLEKRRILTEGRVRKAELLQNEADTIRQEYEGLYRQEQEEATLRLSQLREAGHQQQRKIIEDAKQKARLLLSQKRGELKRAAKLAESQLDVGGLADVTVKLIMKTKG
ncbi:MAG: ATP synthase F0 subunit B [Deltaproteobacteria bacterium]|nr:ATP synthase F0 subunit B [Deltaproteobacteria bacterium]